MTPRETNLVEEFRKLIDMQHLGFSSLKYNPEFVAILKLF